MTGIGAALTILFSLAVFVLPRRFAAVAFMGGVLYITQGQALSVGGVNFMAIRFVELSAILRVVLRGELPRGQGSPTDKWLVWYFVSYLAIDSLRNGAIGMYTLGLLVDGLFAYYAFRSFIREPSEVVWFLCAMVLLLVPFALLMEFESIKGRNLFAVMGGVNEYPLWRNGHFRCQGSFRHAITAGTLGAVFMPLYIGLFMHREHRLLGIVGAVACFAIVMASHSSGPLMCMLTILVAWGCWVIRTRMRTVRWGILLFLIALHFSMKVPVWYIFSKISGIVGGDGWHRSNLIDQFLRHFEQWWLIGMPMEGTVHWAATLTRFGFVDVTNQYVSVGIAGGLVSLVLFIMILSKCLGSVGDALKAIRNGGGQVADEALIWGVGSAVVGHLVNIFAVTYWDQSYVIWYLNLALAASMARYWMAKVPVTASESSAAEPAPAERTPGHIPFGARPQTFG